MQMQIIQCPHMRAGSVVVHETALRARLKGGVLLCRACFLEVVEECRSITKYSDFDKNSVFSKTTKGGQGQGWEATDFADDFDISPGGAA